MIAQSINSPERRMRQLGRVLVVIELLSPLRRGATVDELTSDVNETLGMDYCEKTIARDLDALELMGLVSKVKSTGPMRRRTPPRWQWVDRSQRANALIRAAETLAEDRDPCDAADEWKGGAR